MLAKLKKQEYMIVGILAGATIASAFLLPEPIKILSLGFLSPLGLQVYYMLKRRQRVQK